MGRNGSGKSSLSAVIMGHPAYTVTRGRILFEGKDLTALPAEDRARLGLFLAFQYPVAIPGVSVHNLCDSPVVVTVPTHRSAPRLPFED